MKAIRIATVALCALLLVLPSLAIPIFGYRDTLSGQRPVPYPSLDDGDGGLNADFDEDFEDWLDSRLAFREQILAANAIINYRLLRTSPNPDVIAGSGDWLYYAETAPDYTGEGRLTEAELSRIVDNLRTLSEALIQRGARLYVAVVPNKSTIYPQYMPERYVPRSDGGNIERLKAACAGLPLNWIDLVAPLREAASGDTLVYCKTDTHWNALGAAIGADAVLRGMGREGLDWRVDGSEVFYDGDLARLMGLPGRLTEEVPVVHVDAAPAEADFSDHLIRVDGAGEGCLLMFRDSFAIAAGPYLTPVFERTELRWETPLDAGHDCDVALLMIAERNLRDYLLEEPLVAPDDDESDFEDKDWEEDEDWEDADWEDMDWENGDDEAIDGDWDDGEWEGDDADGI